jgi:Holliday junction DNA helicase RuvA
MIARLRGTIGTIGQGFVVVQVGGVGFQVQVSQALLEDLTGPGQEITLSTYLHVRENELALYGCRSEEELALFRMLIGVSGIGPKVALAILSALPPAHLRMALVQEDVAMLARVPGIGPKTAKKLVFDLKDRMADEIAPGEARPALSEADADLIAALTGLGYSVAEAQQAIRALPPESLPLEERVRQALAYLGS